MSLSNHEMAKRYKEKSKLIGKDILLLRLLPEDRVELVEVLDKEDSGKLVIPSFITDIHVYCDYMGIELNALQGCRFEEVYINNNHNMIMGLMGLCANMKSKAIKVTIRNINKVVDMRYMFDNSKKLVTISIVGLGGLNGRIAMNHMIRRCTQLKNISIEGIVMDNVKVEDMSNIFSVCTQLKNINIDGMDMAKV